jgi:hypothetical protein
MPWKRKTDGADTAALADAVAARRPKPSLSVALRRQTPHERREFETALGLFLTETVRQQLQGQGRDHERRED